MQTHQLFACKVTKTNWYELKLRNGNTVRQLRLEHHTLFVTHMQKVDPPLVPGGRLGDLVSAGRQLQTTVPGLLPGGNAKQDGFRRRG